MSQTDSSSGSTSIGHMSPEQFRTLAHQAVDFLVDYLQGLDSSESPSSSMPVLSRARPGDVSSALPTAPPTRGEDLSSVFKDLHNIILPGLTHWQSPNFYAFFPANGSYPAILGDLLSTGLGVQGMLWATSPACTELELRVADWLAGPELLALDAGFLNTSPNGLGMIQGTASEAAIVAMVAARTRLRARGVPDDRMVVYTSDQSHSSIMKAAMIAGLAKGPDDHARVRLVPVNDRFQMRTDALADQIAKDEAAGLVPMFVCATVGTTGVTAVDPVREIAASLQAQAPHCWLHVDAAFSGCACVCPEFRWHFDGVELADSLVLNPHKWLLTSFDCTCLYTRRKAEVQAALSITPEYLRNAASQSGQVVDLRDYQIPLGRRFRALKLWLVIRHYGVEGLRAYIREHVRIAEIFESLVRADDRFEVTAPRTSALVCFRLRARQGEDPKATDARNRALLDALNASGALYLTHTVLPAVGGRPACLTLRLAIGSAQTQERHVRSAWAQIRSQADTHT